MEFAIIADDLTGASDSGVQLAGCGLRTSLLFRMDEEAARPLGAVVLNTDSRAAAPGEAYAKVREAADFVGRLNPGVVFKKLDSTLRGNIGAELDAMYDACRPDFVVLAPAFPGSGRTTVDGCQYVNGVPLHQSAAGTDPVTPVTESYIPALLAQQSARRAFVVSLAELAEGPKAVAAKLGELREAGVAYLVFDSETDEDLERVSLAVKESGARVVWAGSAGLSRALALRCGAGITAAGSDDNAGKAGEAAEGGDSATGSAGAGGGASGRGKAEGGPSASVSSEAEGEEAASVSGKAEGGPSASGRVGAEGGRTAAVAADGSESLVLPRKPAAVLAVVGSVNAKSRAQLDMLLEAGGTGGIVIRSELLVEGGEARASEIGRAAGDAADLLMADRDAAIYSSASGDDIARAKRAGRERGMSDAQIAAAIAGALGDAALEALSIAMPAGIVMTGGDTAGRICEKLGVSRFDLLGEVETGVPFGTLIFGGNRLHAVTKAGGFGTGKALLGAVNQLKEMNG